MALPQLLSRHLYRSEVKGPSKTLHLAPAAPEMEFFGGAYVLMDITTGLAVRAESPTANTSTDLRPLGVLTPRQRYADDPDDLTHHLDTRGLPAGSFDPVGGNERCVMFWRGGIWSFNLYTGSTPVAGQPAYLVDEDLVRSDATTNGLWIGLFHEPDKDGRWFVDTSHFYIG